MDACTRYTVIRAISNNDVPSIGQAINKAWFWAFGVPEEINFRGGKVRTGKISDEISKINNWSQLPIV
jgi:hypothetical protein